MKVPGEKRWLRWADRAYVGDQLQHHENKRRWVRAAAGRGRHSRGPYVPVSPTVQKLDESFPWERRERLLAAKFEELRFVDDFHT